MIRRYFSFKQWLAPCAVCLITLMPLSPQAAEATLKEVLDAAKQQMRAEDPEGAFNTLATYESRFTGTDSFDYLLGIAALDSGNFGDAIFSFQRLLLSNPGFIGARLDLGRAYFETGDNELARAEFERVLAENPPEQARQVASQYLKAVNNKARSYSPSTQWYVDLGAGYDSNPAAATADDQFLSFVLDSRNVEQSSAYAEAAAGLTYSRPLNAELRWLTTARVSHRNNPSAHYVDPSAVQIGTGLVWERGAHTAGVNANVATHLLDGSANKDDFGVTGNYSYSFTDKWSVDTYGRVGRLAFESDLEVLDVDQVMAGVALTRTLQTSRISAGFVASEDDARETTSPFSSDSIGFRVSAMWARAGGRMIGLEAMAMETDFDDQFFGIDREDDLYSIYLSHTWQEMPSPDWSLTFRIGYSEKDSTVSLYEFDRIEAGILLRKVFD